MHRKCGKSKALAQCATQKKSHTEPRELKRHSHLLEADGNFATDLVETDSHPHCLRGCLVLSTAWQPPQTNSSLLHHHRCWLSPKPVLSPVTELLAWLCTSCFICYSLMWGRHKAHRESANKHEMEITGSKNSQDIEQWQDEGTGNKC